MRGILLALLNLNTIIWSSLGGLLLGMAIGMVLGYLVWGPHDYE